MLVPYKILVTLIAFICTNTATLLVINPFIVTVAGAHDIVFFFCLGIYSFMKLRERIYQLHMPRGVTDGAKEYHLPDDNNL